MNEIMKQKAAGSRVYLWEIAAELGVSDATLSRWLRTEFDKERREAFLEAVDNVKRKRGETDAG